MVRSSTTNTLVHSLFLSEELHTFRCNRSKCYTCPFVAKNDILIGPSGTISLKGSFNCISTHVIYAIVCTRCFSVYIGETGRRLGVPDRIIFRHIPTRYLVGMLTLFWRKKTAKVSCLWSCISKSVRDSGMKFAEWTDIYLDQVCLKYQVPGCKCKNSTRFWNRGYERRRRRPRRPLEFKNGCKGRFLWAVSRRVIQISLRNFQSRCTLWLSRGLASLISVTWKCESWETHDQRAFAPNEESQEGREEWRRLFVGLVTQRVFGGSLRNFHVRRTWLRCKGVPGHVWVSWKPEKWQGTNYGP